MEPCTFPYKLDIGKAYLQSDSSLDTMFQDHPWKMVGEMYKSPPYLIEVILRKGATRIFPFDFPFLSVPSCFGV